MALAPNAAEEPVLSLSKEPAVRLNHPNSPNLSAPLANQQRGGLFYHPTTMSESLPNLQEIEDLVGNEKSFLLRIVQPGLAGLMDGSVSTLAPIFATAFATHNSHTVFLIGAASAVGAGISMAFSEGLSDDGEITGRGNPVFRGLITGFMTFRPMIAWICELSRDNSGNFSPNATAGTPLDVKCTHNDITLQPTLLGQKG